MFKKNPKNVTYVFIALIVFFLLFSKTSLFPPLKLKLVKVASGPISILKFPLKELKKILYYHRTFDEYIRLKQEVDVMNARMVGLQEVVKENARLDDLLRFKRKLIYSSVAANVIGRDPSLWNSTMIIDKGSRNGIKVGMPVVNAYGVVGKIAETEEKISKVMLITDPQFGISAMVQRTRESGVVSGTINGLCRLKYLSANAQVKEGDQVITSKLSTSFPDGLMIGEIIEVREGGNDPSPECIIKPAVAVSQIEEVLVIINDQNI